MKSFSLIWYLLSKILQFNSSITRWPYVSMRYSILVSKSLILKLIGFKEMYNLFVISLQWNRCSNDTHSLLTLSYSFTCFKIKNCGWKMTILTICSWSSLHSQSLNVARFALNNMRRYMTLNVLDLTLTNSVIVMFVVSCNLKISFFDLSGCHLNPTNAESCDNFLLPTVPRF